MTECQYDQGVRAVSRSLMRKISVPGGIAVAAVMAGCALSTAGSQGKKGCCDGSTAAQNFIMVSTGESIGRRYQERAVDDRVLAGFGEGGTTDKIGS